MLPFVGLEGVRPDGRLEGRGEDAGVGPPGGIAWAGAGAAATTGRGAAAVGPGRGLPSAIAAAGCDVAAGGAAACSSGSADEPYTALSRSKAPTSA